MGIYIIGMEMPDYGYVCLKVFSNGEVLMTKECRGALVITGISDKVGTAVPVPPHGDLIDRDVLIQSKEIDSFGAVFAVAKAPTVIPADPAKEADQ